MSACRAGEGGSAPRGSSWRGKVELRGSRRAAASKGVVVAVLGLAELVEEEDDGLQAQDQHYSTDEARSVEGVLVRGRRRGNWCGACADWN